MSNLKQYSLILSLKKGKPYYFNLLESSKQSIKCHQTFLTSSPPSPSTPIQLFKEHRTCKENNTNNKIIHFIHYVTEHYVCQLLILKIPNDKNKNKIKNNTRKQKHTKTH